MKLEDLDKKIEYRERQMKIADEDMQELLDRKDTDEMYKYIYEATLDFLTIDWADEALSGRPKPPMKEFMRDWLSKEAFDFWDRRKNDLFDVLVDKDTYLSDLEWNKR